MITDDDYAAYYRYDDPDRVLHVKPVADLTVADIVTRCGSQKDCRLHVARHDGSANNRERGQRG